MTGMTSFNRSTLTRTWVFDLREGDDILYRTHKGTHLYHVVEDPEPEDAMGMVRIKLRKEGMRGVHTFKTNGVSRFDRVDEVGFFNEVTV